MPEDISMKCNILMQRLPSKEIDFDADSNPEKAVCISLRTNAVVKGMNISLPHYLLWINTRI